MNLTDRLQLISILLDVSRIAQLHAKKMACVKYLVGRGHDLF